MGVRLVFHTNLLPIKNDEFYRNRAEILIATTPVPVMSREDYQLYLLLHGSVSVWHRLKWLVDIPMVSGNGIDYMDSAFYDRCVKLGVYRVVLQGLSLAHQFLDMPISEKISNDLASGAMKKMNSNRAESVLCSEKSPQDSS